MGYWDSSEKWNVGAKAKELLRYRELLAKHEPGGLDCTLLLSVLSMLLCQTNDELPWKGADPASTPSGQSMERLRSVLTQTPRKLHNLKPPSAIPAATELLRWRLIDIQRSPSKEFVLRSLMEHRDRETRRRTPEFEMGTLLYAMRNALAHGCMYWTQRRERDGPVINGAVFLSRINGNPRSLEAFYVPLTTLFWIADWWATHIADCAPGDSIPFIALAEFAPSDKAA